MPFLSLLPDHRVNRCLPFHHLCTCPVLPQYQAEIISIPCFFMPHEWNAHKCVPCCTPQSLPAVFPSLTWSAEMGINHRNLKGSKSAELWAGREFEGCKAREHQEGVIVPCAASGAVWICMHNSCGCLKCTLTRWTQSSKASQGRGWTGVEVYWTWGTKMAAMSSRSLQFLLVAYRFCG